MQGECQTRLCFPANKHIYFKHLEYGLASSTAKLEGNLLNYREDTKNGRRSHLGGDEDYRMRMLQFTTARVLLFWRAADAFAGSPIWV